MVSVDSQIDSANEVITKAISDYKRDRAFLSRIALAQLRNLIEGIAVRIHTNAGTTEFDYDAIKASLAYVRTTGRLSQLRRFHDFVQISVSHYAPEGDPSERLMLKYYEHLIRLRTLAKSHCGLDILVNLEDFPVDLDQSLREYHQKIATRIDALRGSAAMHEIKGRYYIQRVRPFFVNGTIYYEVTFSVPVDKNSKFDRIIAFTDIDMTDKYAAWLSLVRDSIEVLGQTMPIMIIQTWEVSIRPCEFTNFARLFGSSDTLKSSSSEYRNLMQYLTTTESNLLDLIDADDAFYLQVKSSVTRRVWKLQIFPILDNAREIIKTDASGHNVLRYLMLQMRNKIIKQQSSPVKCGELSNLRLRQGCIPFDTMPFCTSLIRHNPRFSDLVESLDVSGREYELLARRVKNNIENRGMLYTPTADLEDFKDISQLIETYNGKLYCKHHPARDLILDKGHVFIQGYEDRTVSIIEKLQEYASSGLAGYSDAIDLWLDKTSPHIDDPYKKEALRKLFAQSRVAVIYGAAGAGKSTMVNYIANYFNETPKLFLAQTNPAIDNLKRRVDAQNATFHTIASQLSRNDIVDYDVLFIDECSTVSNDGLLKVLESISFKLIVLVGDVFQIESIQFGNWFRIIRSFVPPTSVFELTTPFRTKNDNLCGLWSKVRNIGDDITEALAFNCYSSALDASLFVAYEKDEIILCLNYDGLYGINNINRFLQSNNPGNSVVWGVMTYKVGDPVLFNENERFRPLIYNNLKGRIVAVNVSLGKATFDIELERSVDEADILSFQDLTWVEGSTVRFDVFETGNGDNDNERDNEIIPFQIAYAVSIHKAQGLEYDSVKIVITDANEEDVTHSIFYTAITRARKKLRIFWTPETQQKILKDLARNVNSKDVRLLSVRRDLSPT
ncbi:MAG: AAA family ATPase [Nitrososphaerota archaeon]|nr:AAA family ATPase [Nitrososphaerota archaeon]